MNRRVFVSLTGIAGAGALFAQPLSGLPIVQPGKKMKLAVVGTGVRALGFWMKNVNKKFGDYTEFVGLCDINPGRLQFAKENAKFLCPVFTDFEKMVRETKPDTVIVTTVDCFHHEYIIKAMEMGVNVITEKPLTTDESKCQQILDAEKKYGRKLTVTFNYRYGLMFTKIKELLAQNRIGKITSADFHWYLNTDHGAAYFRRWHGLREKSGTLLVHKSSHHFDLMNWFLDSEPEEVFAYGSLDFYGRNGKFRSEKCRGCQYSGQCKYFWDITKDEYHMNIYANNEKYDGYIRDRCVFGEHINIYDKMAVQARYANNVNLSYSLTTYSPYEGWRIAFNGTEGRIDASEGIPWEAAQKIDQRSLHDKEMNQDLNEASNQFDPIMVMDNFGDYEIVKVPKTKGGHGGGDDRMQHKIFADPSLAEPLKHAAGTRDGAMAILLGIAARKSIETGKPVKVGDLTALKPQSVRPN